MPFVKPPELACHSTLLAGRTGVGKTYQLRKVIEAGFNPVYATTERKYATVADLLTEQNFFLVTKPFFPLDGSEKADPNRPSDLIILYDQLRSKDHPFDMLFLDSGMFYVDSLLDYIKKVMKLVFPVSYGDYADRAEKFLKVTTGLVSPEHPKPVDVVVTWGVEIDQNWLGKRSVQPIMDGKRTKPKIGFHFDHVLYLDSRDAEEGGKEYVIHTQGTSEFEAKISSPLKFDPVIVNPDLGKILRQLKAAGKGQPAAAGTPTPPGLITGVKDSHIDHLNEMEKGE